MHQATAEVKEPAGPAAGTLITELEIGLPSRIAVGRGNAFVIAGYSYHPRDRIRKLTVDVGGERTETLHIGMPRADVVERLDREAPTSVGRDRLTALAFRSGFLAIPRLSPRAAATDADVRLVARLAGGGEADSLLGRVRLDPTLDAAKATELAFPGTPGPRVAICMATHNPPAELLRRQIASLRGQTHGNWICLISDDHSRPERLDALVEAVGGDERFLISASERRLGFYRNFERALAMVPASADFVSLCDQDDRWDPHRLERLLERMGPGVELAYSDARVVDADGRTIHPSYWTARPTNYTNFGSLLVANTVPGSASLFGRDLLDDLLPFPPPLGNPFHDHWLSLVALARGRIAYIDDPLYDYVQHGDAVIGHAGANREPRRWRRGRWSPQGLRRRGSAAMGVYYYVWAQQRLFGEVLRLRCETRMDAGKRRALRRFVSADTDAGGVAWLLARRLRRLWGRRETMDVEAHLAKAILWRWAIALVAGRRPLRWRAGDARVPPPPVQEPAVEEEAPAPVVNAQGLDVVIVSYRCRELLRACLASLDANPAAGETRVVVVDNASADGTLEMVESDFPWVELIANERNVGFAAASNQGAARGRADKLLFLNPDTRVTPGALDVACDAFEARPGVGVVGVRLELPSGSLDHAAKRMFPTPLSALGHFTRIGRREGARGTLAAYRAPEVESGAVDAVNGAFMLVRRRAFDQVGGFDEGYWMYMEDLDLCYRLAQAGWTTWYEPTATVVHVKGGTSGPHRSLRLNWAFHSGMYRFYQRHYAPQRPWPLNLAVYVGIGVKLGAAVVASAAARAFAPLQRLRAAT